MMLQAGLNPFPLHFRSQSHTPLNHHRRLHHLRHLRRLRYPHPRQVSDRSRPGNTSGVPPEACIHWIRNLL